MKLLPLSAISLILLGSPAYAQSIHRVLAADARGEGATIPTVTVWTEGGGVNINFIPTGETVKKVWLDDISRLAIDFDGTLCADSSGCEGGGAQVIHLRRIHPVTFPGLPQTKTTRLSVVTEGEGGQKELYQFRVQYGSGSPSYASVDVVPVNESPTPILGSAMTPLPSERDRTGVLGGTRGTPNGSMIPIPVPFTRKAVETRPQSARSADDALRLLEQGLEVAKTRSLVSRARRNLYLEPRVRQYVLFRKKGLSESEAARRARLPLHFIHALTAMGKK